MRRQVQGSPRTAGFVTQPLVFGQLKCFCPKVAGSKGVIHADRVSSSQAAALAYSRLLVAVRVRSYFEKSCGIGVVFSETLLRVLPGGVLAVSWAGIDYTPDPATPLLLV